MNVKRTPRQPNGINEPTITGDAEVGQIYFFRGKSEGIGNYAGEHANTPAAKLGSPSMYFQGAKGLAQRCSPFDLIEPAE